MADPEASKDNKGENQGGQAFRPTVNWNTGNAKTIRTSLRGSRSSVAAPPTAVSSGDARATTHGGNSTLAGTAASTIATTLPASYQPISAPERLLSFDRIASAASLAASRLYATETQNTITNTGDSTKPASHSDNQRARQLSNHEIAIIEGRRLLVGEFSSNVTEEDLRDFFKDFSIEYVEHLRSPVTSQPMGYAHVDASSNVEAKAAIQKLKGQKLRNRNVEMDLAPLSMAEKIAVLEYFKAPLSDVSWNNLIAKAKTGLGAVKAGLEAGNFDTLTSGSATGNAHENVLPASKAGPQPIDQQSTTSLRNSPNTVQATNIEEEDDSGVILNLATREDPLGIPQPERQEQQSLNPSVVAQTLQKSTELKNPKKRDYDSALGDALSLLTEEYGVDLIGDIIGDDSEDGDDEESGEEEEEEEMNVSDGGEADNDESEEGEIAESGSDEDAMVTEYSDANQQSKEVSNNQTPVDIVDVESPPSVSSRESSPQPGLKLEDGPKILRDLSSAELRIQVRYFYVGRDPKTIPESDPVHCTICAKAGHVQKYCPSATCSSCGAFKDHFSRSCPKNVRCIRCRGHHPISDCTLKLKPDNIRLVCDLCQEDGHEEGDCELVWRSSGALWKTPLPAISVMKHCYECGGQGHLGNECSQRKPGKTMGSSMWNSLGLPFPMQPIKDLSAENLAPRAAKPNAAAKFRARKGKGKANDPIDLDMESDDGGLLRSRRPTGLPAKPAKNTNPGNQGNANLFSAHPLPARPRRSEQLTSSKNQAGPSSLPARPTGPSANTRASQSAKGQGQGSISIAPLKSFGGGGGSGSSSGTAQPPNQLRPYDLSKSRSANHPPQSQRQSDWRNPSYSADFRDPYGNGSSYRPSRADGYRGSDGPRRRSRSPGLRHRRGGGGGGGGGGQSYRPGNGNLSFLPMGNEEGFFVRGRAGGR